MSSLNFRLYKNESPVLQQWNMEGVKLYLLWHNFFRNFFIEKLKKYIKEECKSYLFMYNLIMWDKNCSSYPLETVYI